MNLRTYVTFAAAVALLFVSTIASAATLPVTSGLYAWWDGSNIDGSNNSTLTNGATVALWKDSSGNGRDMQQQIGTPTYTASFSGFNNKPTVHFTSPGVGSGTGMRTVSTFGLSSGDPVITLFVVYNQPTFGGEFHPFQMGGGPTGNSGLKSWTVEAANTSSDLKLAGGFGSNYESNYAGPYTNLLVSISKAAGSLNGTNVNMKVNGTTRGTVATSGTPNLNSGTFAWLGASVIFANGGTNAPGLNNGEIAEVVIYDHVLTAAEENSVGYYLAQKYNLTTTYTSPIPEPSAIVLAGFAGLALVRVVRRQAG